MKRIFIAIEIPEEIKNKIIELQKQLSPVGSLRKKEPNMVEKRKKEMKGKLTERENLHITLKFLGEIDEDKIEEVKKRLREIKFKSFEAKVDKIGFFDNQKSQIYSNELIVWLNVANCEKLQKEIDKKLEGLFEKEKIFMGHLTIARTKYIQDKKKFLEELEKIKISSLGFNVKEFVLKESIPLKNKHVYKDLEKYKLN